MHMKQKALEVIQGHSQCKNQGYKLEQHYYNNQQPCQDVRIQNIVNTSGIEVDDERSAIQLSLFTAHKPEKLTKGFKLDDNGSLVKFPGGNLVHGEVERINLETPEEFASLLLQLRPNNALAFGVSQHPRALVYPQTKNPPTNLDLPSITRTRQCFHWPNGPGVMMFDYDPTSEVLSFEALLSRLSTACPALGSVSIICRPSASSCIYNRDSEEELRGVQGLHSYIPVMEAKDIPRATEVLAKRLWLHGQGYIAISRSGALLVRCLIDVSVWQPERLDFCGGADCKPPLEQRLPDPLVLRPEAEYLDTRTALPDLSPAEELEYSRLINEAKKAKHDEAQAIKRLWIDTQVETAVQSISVNDDKGLEAAKQELRNEYSFAVEGQRLGPEYMIILQSGKKVQVQQILDNPGEYHGKRCCDPLEPEYRDDPRIGWINAQATRPYIYSHAHGGQRFDLVRDRVKVQIIEGERYAIVQKALDILRQDGDIFNHGGELADVDSTGNILPLNLDRMQLKLDQRIIFERYDGRKGKLIPKDCPKPIATGVLARKGAWGLPELKAVITAPTMEPRTGRIICSESYDPGTELLLVAQDDKSWPQIPERPSNEEAQAALERIWFPFAEFPFVTAADRGVFLSFILLSAIRAALPTAPGLLITAPGPASGKSLLAFCLGELLGIQNPSVLPKPEKEDELRKRVLALGRTGAPYILMDNLTGILESDCLCSYLTSEFYSDRLLGASETLTIPTRTLFVATGNNVVLEGDLCRRVLTSRIDCGLEDPWNRSFELNPQRYCREHRQEIIADILTVLRWAFLSEYKLPDRTASFEAWSDIVRKAVVLVGNEGWLDVDDPVISIDVAFTEDRDLRNLGEVLVWWRNVYGDAPLTASEAVNKTRASVEAGEDKDGRCGNLLQALDLVAGGGDSKINIKRLGRWIQMMRGRVVKNLYFQPAGESRGSKLWRVLRKD